VKEVFFRADLKIQEVKMLAPGGAVETRPKLSRNRHLGEGSFKVRKENPAGKFQWCEGGGRLRVRGAVSRSSKGGSSHSGVPK